MSDHITLEALLCMKPENEGRLSSAVGVGCCPHLVVPPSSECLGVVVSASLISNKQKGVLPEDCGNVLLIPLYPETVNYDALVEGAEFEIKEGGKTVGNGTVIRREENMAWVPKSRLTTAASLPFLASIYSVFVVHCGAVWNGYDGMMDRMLQELQSEYGGKIDFRALDYDDGRNWIFLKEANVINLPALVCFVNGERYETLIGMRSKEELIAKFEEWIVLAE